MSETTASAATTATATRTQQALARAQALLGGAIVSACALAAPAAEATVLIPSEPTLEFGGSRSGNHNSSGWFTNDSHTGSASGRAFGTLDEGVKLYGQSSLATNQYMFNTLTRDSNGWDYYASTSTGLAMAWWGTAHNLRAESRDPDTGDLLQAGDTLAFNYEFSLTGPAGTSWHLRGGFTDYLNLDSNSSLLQSSFLTSSGEQGYLTSDGLHTFTGAVSTGPLNYLPPDSGPVYWVVTLTADLPYAPSMGLTLTVPQNSIDAGVNMAPVPEPSQWALLLAGLGAVATVAKRRKAAH